MNYVKQKTKKKYFKIIKRKCRCHSKNRKNKNKKKYLYIKK